jgi:fumarate reductase flavoprotein subunit
MTGTVLEEGLRGAGGYLLDGSERRFMHDYDAQGERATRDIVSRAIYAEMRAGRTTPNGGVHIAMDHLGPAEVAKRFPGMVKRCADCGFDLAGGRVEVVPTAHYLMGGVVVEPDTRSGLPGLFIAGEDAGGAHGANRLGGNGVANSTVFGGIAGDEMAVEAKAERHWAPPDERALQAGIERAMAPFGQPPGDVNGLRDRLLDLMWDGVGVLRDANGLATAQAGLRELKAELDATGIAGQGRVFNLSWHDWLNLDSLLAVSEVIAAAALSRENSRGAHFREDFTAVGSLEDSYFTVARLAGEAIQVERAPVEFTIVKPGESLI